MTGKEPRPAFASTALLPSAVVLGLLVLAWAATTGPVRMLRESGRIVEFGEETPSYALTDSPDGPGPTLEDVTRDVRPRFHLAWLGDVIAMAFVTAVCVAVFLALRWLWRHRWHPPEKPLAVEFEVLPERLVEALRQDVAAQLGAVAEGSPRNAIVACWLRLQDIVADAGLPPRPSETSTEFVVRTLRALDLDPRPIGRLAGLYREARFSDHALGEDSRTAAREALEALHEDLRARGAVS